jgi:hypothetical protein
MSGTARDAELRLVCEVAADWAGEYGFSVPDRAKAVLAAVFTLCPDALDERTRNHFATQETETPEPCGA